MKNHIILLGVCLLAIFASCENKPELITEEYVEVALKPKGVDMTESPLSKAGTSSDLYGLEIMVDDDQIYACWVTDDISSSTIRLLKGKTYNFHLMYVPDGKNIIASSGKTYGNPFFHLGPLRTPEIGSIYYGGNYDMNYGCFGTAQKKGKGSSVQANAWNDVDIYYGFKQVKAESDMEVNINLYREMFGLEITATNFSRGTLHVYSGMAGCSSYGEAKGYDAYIYDLTPSSPKLDKVLEMNYMPWCSFNIAIHSEEEVANWCEPGGGYAETLHIAYTTPDGETLELISQSFIAKRMTKYSVIIDVDELVQEYYGTLTAKKIETEWITESLEL